MEKVKICGYHLLGQKQISQTIWLFVKRILLYINEMINKPSATGAIVMCLGFSLRPMVESETFLIAVSTEEKGRKEGMYTCIHSKYFYLVTTKHIYFICLKLNGKYLNNDRVSSPCTCQSMYDWNVFYSFDGIPSYICKQKF